MVRLSQKYVQAFREFQCVRPDAIIEPLCPDILDTVFWHHYTIWDWTRMWRDF